MEKSYGNDSSSFQRFLSDFCKTVIVEAEEDDTLPFRILSDRLTPDEIHGECLDWTLRYLGLHNCPPTLASLIAREVYNEIRKINYLEFAVKSSDSTTPSAGGNEVASNGDLDNDKIRRSDTGIAYKITFEIAQALLDHKLYVKRFASLLVEGRQSPLRYIYNLIVSFINPFNPKYQNVLDSSSLCPHVIDLIHETCQKWNEQLPEIQLPSQCHQTSFYEIKNTRRKMEDRHVILPDYNSLFDITDLPYQAYYAVFDGHAGTEAAVFASNHLHTHLPTCEQFSSDPAAALKCCYSATDADFIKKAQRENLKSGSTGVSALIRGNKLYVAWLGDSQALLVRNGQAVNVMEPHKPEREDEKSRIEALGGCVVFMGTWRVNGNLAVSRAIGDIAQKLYICSDADVTTVDLDGTEDYLVLACDGLWDTVPQDAVPKIVYDHLQETKGDKSSVAKTLVNSARDAGSSDNITVIVVFLRNEISPPHIKPLFDFGQTPSSQGDNVDNSHDDNSGADNSSSGGLDRGDNSNMDTSGADSSNQSGDRVDENTANNENSQELKTPVLERGLSKPLSSRQSLGQSDTYVDEISNNRDYFPPNHVLKKESVFIVGDDKRISPGPVLDTNSQNSVIPSSTEAQVIQPSYIFLPSQTSTISEFHRRLGAESLSESMENGLPPVRENFNTVTDYFIHSDPHGNGKKFKSKKSRKNAKEGNRTNFTSPQKGKKKVDSKEPVIWAFTGKNMAPVQNYKLNYAAKSTPRIALAPLTHSTINQSPSVPATQDIKYLDKITKSKNMSTHDSKSLDSVSMPHTVFNYPLSVFTNSTISSKSVSTSTPRSTSTTKQKGTKKTLPEFHQTWRPKRPSKIMTSGFSELPPTPLSNRKIHRSTDP